jgi:hypothetical protein
MSGSMLFLLFLLLLCVVVAQTQTPRPPLSLQEKIRKLYTATGCQNCDSQCTGSILTCDQGFLVNINLSNRNLSGSIDQVFDALREFKDTVQYIDMRRNRLTGDLTGVSFRDFTNLLTLDLSDNFWHGTWTTGRGVRTPFSLLTCVIQLPNEPGCVVCEATNGGVFAACTCVSATAAACTTTTASRTTTTTIASRSAILTTVRTTSTSTFTSAATATTSTLEPATQIVETNVTSAGAPPSMTATSRASPNVTTALLSTTTLTPTTSAGLEPWIVGVIIGGAVLALLVVGVVVGCIVKRRGAQQPPADKPAAAEMNPPASLYARIVVPNSAGDYDSGRMNVDAESAPAPASEYTVGRL